MCVVEDLACYDSVFCDIVFVLWKTSFVMMILCVFMTLCAVILCVDILCVVILCVVILCALKTCFLTSDARQWAQTSLCPEVGLSE